MDQWAGLGVLLFGAGGTLWALRMVLRNKLITSASHDEHMRQWADQVKALRERLSEQEASHRAERTRDAERTEARNTELHRVYAERLADRDARMRELAAQLDRAWSAFTLTDEAYQQMTSGRIHEYGSALRTLANVLRASPLTDTPAIEPAPTVGRDDDRPASDDPGSVGGPG